MTGSAMSFSLALVQGAGMEQALDVAGKGFGTGVVTGGIAAFGAHYVSANQNGEKPIQAKETANEGIEFVESEIKGFTKHATNQAVTRGFKTSDILKVVREGEAVQAMGRYDVQTRYTLVGTLSF